MDEIQSPYGQTTRTLKLAGTDIPAVDGAKGLGDEPLFNRFATANGERQINANSKQDFMAQVGGLIKRANSSSPLKYADDSAASAERWASFKQAYRTADLKPMQVYGEVMSDEIWETLGREGFSNKLLAIQNIGKGATGRVKVRRKDVVAFQITGDVKVTEQKIRQPYIYPAEFTLAAYIVIDDKEIELN